MKNLTIRNFLFSLSLILTCAVLITSCSKEADMNLDQVEVSSPDLPVAPNLADLTNTVNEPLLPSQAYKLDEIDETTDLKASARSCAKTVRVAYLRYYRAYVNWFYNPTPENYRIMTSLYCDYRIAYSDCYNTPYVC